MEKIGFIGLGTMGKGMALNLLKAGYPVVAYNRDASKGDDIKDEDFSMVKSPGLIPKQADKIFVCVSNDHAVEDVILGKDGVLSTMRQGLLVDCSTVAVDMTERISKRCREIGIDFLDAPVTGSKLAAASGSLTFMVGGDKDVLDKTRKYFDAMGKRIVHCGENTMGQRAKLALNLAQAMTLEVYLEALALGIKNGVGIEPMMEILDNSGARSNISAFKMPYILNQDFEQHFKLGLMRKDVHLALKEIGKLGMKLPLAEKIAEVYDETAERFGTDKDFIVTSKLIEERNGLRLHR